MNNYTHDQFEYGPARVALFRRHAAAVVARRSAGGGGRSRAVTGAALHHRSAANTSFAGPPALVRRGTDDTAPRRYPGPGPPFAAFRGAAACGPVGSTAPAYYAAALVPCVRRRALPRGGRAASNSVNISRIRPFPPTPTKDNFTDVSASTGIPAKRTTGRINAVADLRGRNDGWIDLGVFRPTFQKSMARQINGTRAKLGTGEIFDGTGKNLVRPYIFLSGTRLNFRPHL